MIAAGQLIGNYRIVSKIGTGGMGAVYLAEHPMIGKKVALKVIHRELASNKDVVQRFFQEARAVNTIGNEHIVEIHDFGVTPEGDHFYIMEYLEGRTLASVLARETALDTMRALHVGAQIASALSAAHVSGVIHRDLKPDNIMLMTRLGDPDFVKVLDFGLAKMFQASGASAVQTAAGVLLGTPQYMSPEACESKRDVDHRTDIYALGILLFQMMTGVLPFDGESMGEVLVKQVTQLPPAPRGLNSMIPPSVEQILLRCLAKPPEMRFPTMQALREALLDPEAYLRASPPIAPARSVAPGEAMADARAVQAHANARTRMQQADQARADQARTILHAPASAGSPSAGMAATMIGQSIPPPAQKSRQIPVPGLVQPTEPKHNTMIISTPMGYSSRPPRRVWPIVLVIGMIVGLGGGAFAVAWFGRSDAGGEAGSAAGGSNAAPSAGSSGTTAGSSATPPAGSNATGAGSSTGSAGSSAVSAGSNAASAGSNAGSAGSNAASAGSNAASAGSNAASAGSNTTSAGSNATTSAGSNAANAGSNAKGSGSGSGAVTASGSGAGSGKSGVSVTPINQTAKLTLTTTPAGATVLGPDGADLGKTPLKLDWPISDQPVTFTLKLRGYRDSKKEVIVTTNTMMPVDMVRAPAAVKTPGNGTQKGSGKGSGEGGNGLIRPDDL